MTAFDAPCRLCGRTDYPHTCMAIGPILNSRYYCPDGERHVWRNRTWRRPVCERCGERESR